MLVSPAVPPSDPRPTGRMPRLAEPTGHVFLRQGKRGGVWYAKYRLPDGRQVKKRIGPAGPVTRRRAEASKLAPGGHTGGHKRQPLGSS